MKHRKDTLEDIVSSCAASLLSALCCLPAFLAQWKDDEEGKPRAPTPHPRNKTRKQTELLKYLGFNVFNCKLKLQQLSGKPVNRGEIYLLLYKCILMMELFNLNLIFNLFYASVV